ncbi:ThyX-like thymidylate synthase [Gordonia Phage Odesza]|uniref:Thymidylate synthase n=5 Tax=Tanisvirus tanis TaxID=2844677 RepID=A0A7D5FQV9_9CAUD|nr:thymidylate synthase [Gordonia phage Tanis]AVO25309.1 ThyX-like thymidylate synthase [Gordonia phage Gravy]AVO25402.1 ThyX-like thymidylate synthase [Gordonia phage Kerry]QGJ89680.1 ThyX-like thymidylate synthase [Gordonia Phage Odesza]QKY78741.1 thymidylate synthase [Gordonia phage Gill]QLF83787.1 thymidylate synthase [Gordonia phage Magel]QYW00709.1 ThyX-like thymidylate synthase [Gordonia phage Roney]
MSENKTYVHFYKTVRNIDNPSGEMVDGEPVQVSRTVYSWYLQKANGMRLELGKAPFNSPGEAIDSAVSILGEGFWNSTNFVITESWYNHLLYGHALEGNKESYSPEDYDLTKDEALMSEDDHTTVTSDLVVDLVQRAGSDEMICQAARVSTLGAESLETEESAGLINFLMKNRHGSPFEHGLMTFRITAPIFVWREFMRHRVGFSYNEQSGRYMELDPLAYIPDPERPLIQIGKAGAYEFVPGSPDQYEIVIEQLCKAYDQAWSSYHTMLDAGIAKEIARICLPVATYSTAYVTCNPRSLMSFLSLRTKHEGSTFPSYPQYEISAVANKMESIFAELFPTTHAAFNKNGRVSP